MTDEYPDTIFYGAEPLELRFHGADSTHRATQMSESEGISHDGNHHFMRVHHLPDPRSTVFKTGEAWQPHAG